VIEFVIPVITVVNGAANALGGFFLYPVAVLPSWLSINIISGLLGILLLLIFKYTSNQNAIACIRDDIKVNILAIRLYHESSSVALASQVRIFIGSLRLLFHSIVPMLIMIVPISLILVQMGLWYQAHPVRINDDPVVVTIRLNNDVNAWPQKINLKPQPEILATIGPVRAFSKKEIHWKVKPVKKGYHTLVFQLDNQHYEKQLAAGDGFMRLSMVRPGQNIAAMFLNPLEKPFLRDSMVHSIRIDFPERDSIMFGTDAWLIYFFVASMVFAFLFKPVFRVRI